MLHLVIKEDKEGCIILPHFLQNHNVFKEKLDIVASFGQKKVQVPLRFHEGEELILSKKASKILCCPYNDTNINIIISNKMIRIGPLIAIYAKEDKQGDFGVLKTLLISFFEVSKKYGAALMVFAPDNIDFKNQTVNGYLYNEVKDSWENNKFPMPDIIMDRGIFVSTTVNKTAHKEREYFKINNKVIKFNSAIGSKYDTFNILFKNSILKQHLPHTIVYNTYTDIINMLNIYKEIYLKPAHGTQGKGIIKISKNINNYSVKIIGHNYICKSTNGLKSIIKNKLIIINKKKYIIQQGIHLYKRKNKIIDFRLLLQKNKNMRWGITALLARISKDNGITTNLSLGGSVADGKKIINKIAVSLNKNKDSLIQQLNDTALLAAITLESHNGIYGELGIDLGLDENGDIWIIEINPRPGRKSLKILNDEIRTKSIDIPISYCIELWQQKFRGKANVEKHSSGN
jgi:glutathione synthase/RimK-type ligase-like ATP-grasp enzyme